MKFKFTFISILTAFFLLFSVCVCTAAPEAADSLLISAPLQIISLDPAVVTDGVSAEVCSNIYETLVKIDPKTKQILPCLAARWYSNSDYTRWRFVLRKNVYFSDGTLFDGYSVKFAFNRQMDPKSRYHFPKYGYFSYYAAIFGGYPGVLLKVSSTEKYEVEFIFNKSVPDLLEVLSLPQFGIPSPVAVKRYGNAFYTNPAGTGPYKLASWNYDSRLVLVKNMNYRGVKPYINKVLIQLISNHDHRLSLMRKGYSDMMISAELDDYYKLKNYGSYEAQRYPCAFDVILGMNCRLDPFKNNKMREAIKYILSREVTDLINLFEPAHKQMNYKNIFAKQKGVTANYIKAQKKLVEAGFERGNDRLEFVYPRSFPLYASDTDLIADKIKFLLNQCGFSNVKLRPLSWDKFIDAVALGDYHLALIYTDLKNRDEKLFYLTYFNQLFPAKYNLNKFHWYSNDLKYILKDIQDAGSTYSEKTLLEEMNYYVYDNTPYVFLNRLNNTILFSSKLKNLSFDNNGYLKFNKIYIAR
ncbi:MAG: ABC transporter substrate-binding protein [Armatimonadota bacterium]